MKGKKGSIEDSIFIVLLLFMAGLVFMFAFIINNAISSSAAPLFESMAPGSSVGFTAVDSIFNNTLNYVYLAFFFGLIISLIITSFMTPTHPIFFILSIISFVALLIVSVALSNMYESISRLSAFSSAVDRMPIMDYILLNLPLISVIIGIISAIIIFSRAGEEGE